MATRSGKTVFASYNIHKCVGSDRRFDPARIAAQWQVPERLLQALEGGMDEPLVRSLRAGELMATLSLLLAFGEIAESDCEPLAVATGIDDDMYKAAWARIGRAS